VGGVRRNGRSLWRRIRQTHDDGSIEIEFAYHNAEAVLKAKRATSSTAC
jgi:hypothetical protein